MEVTDIQDLIRQSESTTLAKFETFETEVIAQTVCAMANTKGGNILIGARRNELTGGKATSAIVGVSPDFNSEKARKDVESLFDIQPYAVDVNVFTMARGGVDEGGKPKGVVLAVVNVEKSTNKEPISISGGFIWRRKGIKNESSEFKPSRARTQPAKSAPNPSRQQSATAQSPSDEPSTSGSSRERDQIHESMPESDPIGDESNDPSANTQTKTPPELNLSGGGSDPPEQPLPDEPAMFSYGGSTRMLREASNAEEGLNCQEYARVLASFFSSTEQDLCFGLFGHWGRGKTYLINRVSELLAASHGYETVKFSAWKYRSNTEVWAFLYETFSEASRKSHIMSPVLTPIRAMLARYGIWPITLGYISLGISLYSVQDKVAFGQFVFQFLGVAGTAYVLILFFRLNTFWKRVGQPIFATPTHRSILGLQASIGNDLDALLTGWLPKDHWVPRILPESTDSKPQKFRVSMLWPWMRMVARTASWPKIITYFMAVAYVFWQLQPPDKPGMPSSVAPLVYYAWLVASVVLPVLALFLAQGPKRLLLVVDDLDRCEPTQMLEIVESIMLLLDNPEVRRRMQIAMLVEEEALEAALLKKYSHLQKQNHSRVADPDKTVNDTIVRENLDKIFLSYLRLPAVTPEDFQSLLRKYIDASLLNAKASSDSEAEVKRKLKPAAAKIVPTVPVDTESDSTNSEKGEQPSIGETTLQFVAEPELALTKSEGDKILKMLCELQKDKSAPIRWGPRTARCLLHKYRLARAILSFLSPASVLKTEDILTALMPRPDGQPVAESLDPIIKYAAEQVR